MPPQVMHLKGEVDRLKEKLRLADKSAAATQLQMQRLFAQVDALQGKGNAQKKVCHSDAAPL